MAPSIRSHARRYPTTRLDPPLWRGTIRGVLARHPAIYWTLSIAMVGTSVLTGLSLASDAQHSIDAWGDRQTVMVSVGTLLPGHEIQEGDFEERDYPRVVVPRGVVTTPPTGRIVGATIHPDEQIRSERLGRADGTGPSALLPPGKMAVAVPTSAVIPPVQVGDLVDVLATFDAFFDSGDEPTITVATSASVIDVSDQAITVAITPAEIQSTTLGLTRGLVTLALVGRS